MCQSCPYALAAVTAVLSARWAWMQFRDRALGFLLRWKRERIADRYQAASLECCEHSFVKDGRCTYCGVAVDGR